MTAIPPPPPPSGPPPSVPGGWKAEWSGEHNAWYFFNQATQQSTWTNPMNKVPPPPTPPPYMSAYPAQPNSLYDADDKSSTTRGASPLIGFASGVNQPYGYTQPPPVNTSTRPNAPMPQGTAPLYIHAACFGDVDITAKVRSLISSQQTLTIRCDTLTYHFGDPWPMHVKQFSLLYSYGTQPWQLVSTIESKETITLHPIHPVDPVRAEFVQRNGAGGVNGMGKGKVVALVWGTSNALGDAKTTTGRSKELKLMEIEREGRLEASNTWMGFDGHHGIHKLAVCYYRNADGSVGIATAREGETLRLPWNAFAGAI